MTAAVDEARRDVLRKKIELKRRIEQSSLQSVEALLEKNITEDMLISHCQNLWQQSYQDCTEERALVELCGYPLCDNSVPPQSQRLPRFKICTRTNKVFSMEKRRMFCSSFCQKSSEWLRLQLSELPLWMLEELPNKRIEILRKSQEKNVASESVIPNVEHIRPDQIDILTDDMKQIRINETAKRKHQISQLRSGGMSDMISVDRLESLLSEWITISTLRFIVGPDRFLEIRSQYDTGITGGNLDSVEFLKKYENICHFLNEQDKQEGIKYGDDDEDEKPTVKPINRTVRTAANKKKLSFKKQTANEQTSETANVSEPILPFVEKHHAAALRKRIFLERLAPTLEQIKSHLPTSPLQFNKDIVEFIDTLNLNKDNCVPRHREVPFIVAAILMMLDRRANGEGQLPQAIRLQLDEKIRSTGLSWGDIRIALQKATDPQRLFQRDIEH